MRNVIVLPSTKHQILLDNKKIWQYLHNDHRHKTTSCVAEYEQLRANELTFVKKTVTSTSNLMFTSGKDQHYQLIRFVFIWVV